MEDKKNEFVRLITALGATRVRVRSEQQSRTRFGLAASLFGFGASVRAGEADSNAAETEELFAPEAPPALPDDLVWYPHEPEWQALAQRRIALRTQHAALTIRLTRSSELGLSLRTTEVGLGLDGGDTSAVTLHYEICFEQG